MAISPVQDSVRGPTVAGSSATLDSMGVWPDVVGMRLGDLATGASARVVSVAVNTADADASGGDDLSRRLAELGFLPGERLRIVARGFLGREPIAVRIGTGTFALRSYEAACIRVSPELP